MGEEEVFFPSPSPARLSLSFKKQARGKHSVHHAYTFNQPFDHLNLYPINKHFVSPYAQLFIPSSTHPLNRLTIYPPVYPPALPSRLPSIQQLTIH